MAKLCECCGKKNNAFSGDPFYLTKDKILCHKCAKPIRSDMDNLYYIKTPEEYGKLKNKIVSKSRECFNDAITECVISVINKRVEQSDLYKSDLYKKEQPTDLAAFSTASNPTTSTGHTSAAKETKSASGTNNNVGGGIKKLAHLLEWLGAITFAGLGLAIMIVTGIMEGGVSLLGLFLGCSVMILGGLMTLISCVILYGFGQLVENSDKLVEMSKQQATSDKNDSSL